MRFNRIFLLVMISVVGVVGCKTPENHLHDWLLNPKSFKAKISVTDSGNSVELSNGLIRRTIHLKPNAATVAFDNLMTGESLIRAVRPEALVTLEGKQYKVGGLPGQVEQAYLRPEWIDSLHDNPLALQFVRYEIGPIRARLPWKPRRWCTNRQWPPAGKALNLYFKFPSDSLKSLVVAVHYALYDGLPLISKWLTLRNDGDRTVRLNRFVSENLAMVEGGVWAEAPHRWAYPNIHIESDYAFGGMTPNTANKTTYWLPDSLYLTQVDYGRNTPCLLQSKPPLGPDLEIAPGDTFESFRTFELVYDSFDKERRGLALRKMYRTIAPWTTENPIFLHLTSTDPTVVKRAVDQCKSVGFEMIILSFGSGLNMESDNPQYIAKIKSLVDYAHARGIEMGGYSLLASRRISDEDDVISPRTGKPDDDAAFGHSPCLGSRWGEAYFKKLTHFLEAAHFDLLEHDGSYPGDLCASTKHPGHRGLLDSQWKQWRKITDFYRWCRGRDIYLNVPDWYFLSGSNKTGMGYRETNWSLPRERQIILARQNIFDGTWYKTPSMGWMFVPLVQYHGGGAAATLEPLSQHLKAYESHLVLNFGAGVQACYRGPRLYDTEKTEALVKKWVIWYKKYRAILNSDIIHVRRPDARDVDCILHVNPGLKEKGLALIFNPMSKPVRRILRLPLYYTGLQKTAHIREAEKPAKVFHLDRKYYVNLPLEIPAGGFQWFVIEK